MNIRVFSPATLEDALNSLKQQGGQVLAGGTDLIIELRKHKKRPQYLVDISNIEELMAIEINDNNIKLGSMVTFGQIINNEYIKANVPSLWEAAYSMGACQIQNRATIGGNICNAAPAADSIPVFLSLNALCEIKSSDGNRTVPVNEVVLGSGKTSLKEGEMLTAVTFDVARSEEAYAFAKLGKRNALAISTISCAIRLYCTEGTIKEAYVCTGSLGSKAEIENSTQAYLLDKQINAVNIEEAAEVLSIEVYERLKERSSIAYKKIAVKGIFKEAIKRCILRLTESNVKDVKHHEG